MYMNVVNYQGGFQKISTLIIKTPGYGFGLLLLLKLVEILSDSMERMTGFSHQEMLKQVFAHISHVCVTLPILFLLQHLLKSSFIVETNIE